MKTIAKWGIGLGVGIPGALILIGIIGIIVKFIMKKCRRRAWDDINSLPKHLDSSDNTSPNRLPQNIGSDREPLVPTATTEPVIPTVAAVSDGHITIPIDVGDLTSSENQHSVTTASDMTLVQAQRDRLNRLREEENRTRPLMHRSSGEIDIESVIQQAQKDFDDSV